MAPERTTDNCEASALFSGQDDQATICLNESVKKERNCIDFNGLKFVILNQHDINNGCARCPFHEFRDDSEAGECEPVTEIFGFRLSSLPHL